MGESLKCGVIVWYFWNSGVIKLIESENDLGISLKIENMENIYSFVDGGDFFFKWLISSIVI